MKYLKQNILSWTIKVLNFIFAAISISLLLIAVFRPDLVKDFLSWIEQTIKWLGSYNYFIAFWSSLIESFPVIWVLVPWMQVMLMVWWFFWANALFNVIMVAIIWAIIWNYAWFLLWIRYWDDFFKNYWEWFWLWKTELKILKNQIDKNWALFIIFGKFHNFTRAFVPFIAWSMWMKHKNFWIYNIVWSIIWATTIISIWVVFAKHYKKVVDNIEYIMLAIIVSFSLYIFFFKREEFKTYLKEKNNEIDEKLSKDNNPNK